jgi:peptide/nickel transport system permease protein
MAEPTPATDIVDPAEPSRREARVRFRRELRNTPPLVVFAGCWLVVVLSAALLAPLLPLADPGAIAGQAAVKPFTDWAHPLGTDNLSRSVLSRIIYGARVSLAASVLSVSIAFVIGTLVGIAAGYFRGWFDQVVGLLVDSLLAFPGLMTLLALVAVFGASLKTLILGLSIVALPSFVRLARAGTIQVCANDYIRASRGLGASRARILVREIGPNMVGTVISYAIVHMGGVMLAEASLSFLGLGIPSPTPSWGGMIKAGQNQLSVYPYLIFVPAAVMFLTIVSLNLVGENLRGRTDSTNRL